jgi:hypothetical protein
MNGRDLVDALKRKFRVKTNKDLSRKPGVKQAVVQSRKNRTDCSTRQMAGLVHTGSKAGIITAQREAIRPLVEFYPLCQHEYRLGNWLDLLYHSSENQHASSAGGYTGASITEPPTVRRRRL